MGDTPKRPGRPPKEAQSYLQPVTVRFPPAMMAQIEAIMRDRPDQPEKGQVIRELVAAGLAAKAKEKRK